MADGEHVEKEQKQEEQPKETSTPKEKHKKEKDVATPKEKKKEVKKPDSSGMFLIPLETVYSFAHLDWIVFINPKSGGQQGAAVLKAFEGVLPADQIFNLFEGGPRPG
jgi:hypothetical protein